MSTVPNFLPLLSYTALDLLHESWRDSCNASPYLVTGTG